MLHRSDAGNIWRTRDRGQKAEAFIFNARQVSSSDGTILYIEVATGKRIMEQKPVHWKGWQPAVRFAIRLFGDQHVIFEKRS